MKPLSKASSIDVVATGIGLHTALGPTAAATWKNLMAGKSAIASRQPFLDLAPSPLAMAGKQPLALAAITRAVVQAAWEDAGLNCVQPQGNSLSLETSCGVVVGSSRSYLHKWETMAIAQRQGAFEGNWLEALPNGPALMAARLVGSSGPVLAPMAACATGVWAIAQAADLIRNGQCDRVVAGAVESPITPLTLAGFGKMGALAQTGCYPFDRNREGFVLGEGGAMLVLESAVLAKARGAKVYGRILAAGMTNDSHHLSSFEPSYAMGRRAVEHCLQRSKLMPTDIDAVHMHGTSTAQNDQMEASLVGELLGRQVRVMASKGATGHTLGASGALSTALGLLSLQRQEVLPCVGLRSPDFSLNFVRQGQAARVKNLLCLSFGFGGQNAALALAQE
ncbi:MAG: beta-ketoacyl-ACP synthase [Phormidesmis sp.]